MQFTSLLSHSAQVLELVNSSESPVDNTLREFFRSKKYIGARDRRVINNLVFLYIRIKLFTDFVYEKNKSLPNSLNEELLSHQVKVDNIIYIYSSLLISFNLKSISIIDKDSFLKDIKVKNEEINEFLSTTLRTIFDDDDEIINSFLNSIIEITNSLESDINDIKELSDDNINKVSIYYSLPDWIITSLAEDHDIDFIKELGQQLYLNAPTTLRVNRLKRSREDLLAELEQHDIEAEPTSLSPWGVKLSKRINLNDYKFYKFGRAEIQDEGSQLISAALNPKKYWNILDACAGAGGKSIHLAALQHDKGKIYSADIAPYKLKEIKNRASRAMAKSITCFVWKDTINPKYKYLKSILNRGFDAVLVDAPCSGTGTFRRNPMQKWNISYSDIVQYSSKQKDILEKYSRYVKPGGILLYATCSIMPEENQDIANNFLENNPNFKADKIDFKDLDIELNPDWIKNNMLTLYPHLYDGDGFFIARFKRTV